MKLFAFGLGYCARHYIARSGKSFESIAGTVRGPAKAEELAGEPIETLLFSAEHEDPAIAARIAAADVILVSIRPAFRPIPCWRGLATASPRSGANRQLFIFRPSASMATGTANGSMKA